MMPIPVEAILRHERFRHARPWTALASLIAVIAGVPAGATAQRVMHRARFGQTLPSLAKQYYGDQTLAPLLATVNGRPIASQLRPGDRLRIPSAWTYRVPRTTTVAALAKLLLKDGRRAFALRAFNRLRGRRVRAGTEILVPFTLTHAATRGDTFVTLARQYYRNPVRAGLIARYNFLKGDAPPMGEELEIPIWKVRITSARLRALLNQRVLGVGQTHEDETREALQEANGLLRRGDYSRVPLRLIRMLAKEHVSDSYTAEVFKLMAIAYVAQGKHDLAVRAFREALLRQPTLKLDAVRDSPKVIRALVDAKTYRDDQR